MRAGVGRLGVGRVGPRRRARALRWAPAVAKGAPRGGQTGAGALRAAFATHVLAETARTLAAATKGTRTAQNHAQ